MKAAVAMAAEPEALRIRNNMIMIIIIILIIITTI